MKKLLKFEFRKLIKSPFPYICLAFFLIFTILGVVATHFGMTATGSFDPNETKTIVHLTLSAITPIMGYPLFFIVLSVFVCSYCCSENGKNGIMKNVYSKGFSREKVFFAKYILSFLYTLVVTFSCFILAFIVGVILLKNVDGFSGKIFINILIQLIIVVGIHGIIFAIATKIGKSGGSITINVLMQMFIPVILMLLQMFIGQNFLESFNFYYLFPTAIISLLTTTSLTSGVYLSSIITSFAFMILCLPLSFLSIRKREY